MADDCPFPIRNSNHNVQKPGLSHQKETQKIERNHGGSVHGVETETVQKTQWVYKTYDSICPMPNSPIVLYQRGKENEIGRVIRHGFSYQKSAADSRKIKKPTVAFTEIRQKPCRLEMACVAMKCAQNQR